MDVLQSVVDYLLSLGAAIFVPIIIIIAGLIVRMKVKDAISAGVTLGVAFTGMTMLISFMTGAISPAAEAMLTNTFNADLWNVWGKIFTAVGVVAITGSVPLAFVVATIQIIFELKTADVHQRRIEELSGIPGVTCTHKMVLFGALMYPIDCLLRKIPAFNKKFDAQSLKDKVGIFAENHVLGFILGVAFGLLAGYEVSATLTLAIQCATALTLFPVITKYFMQALSPISEAVSDFMNKKFKGRTLLVGLDWPFLGGSNEIWLAVIWSVPVTLICAMILPGNDILPFAGIINLALAVPAYLVTKGNLPRMLILCTLGVPAFLWVGTAFAPFITDLANTTGAVALKAGEMISNSSIDGPVFTYAISQVFDLITGNWIPLIVLVVWVVCYTFYYRELSRENKAAAEAEALQASSEASGE